jgi:hypothetical protein
MFSTKPKSRFETKPIIEGVELTQTYMDGIESVATVYRTVVSSEETKFYSAAEKSGWVKQTQNLFYATLLICDLLRTGTTCVISCLNGWDRTP